MPWQEFTIMSQRLEFVVLARKEGANVARLCRRFGISRKTGYKWLRRFAASGEEGLVDQSRRPHHSPGQTARVVEDAILRLRTDHPVWGARKIRARLVQLQHDDLPSPSTITAILQRNQCITPEESEHHRAWQRFEASMPNELWQMDFKGHFALVAGRCYPLTVLDDHSRFALGICACANQRGETVQEHLTAIFRRYGLPQRILVDNGAPWGGRRRLSLHAVDSVVDPLGRAGQPLATVSSANGGQRRTLPPHAEGRGHRQRGVPRLAG